MVIRTRSSTTRPSSTSTWEAASMLSVEGLEVRYGGYLALSDVSLHVAAREIVCLMGANGSGKGSLMNAVSGGEQQSVAIGRALISQPRFIMLDEPFLGLSPRLVLQVGETMRRINAGGVTVLFTEQAIQQSLSIADRGYILESGRLALSGTSAELLANDLLQRVYMGLDGAIAIGDDADAARRDDGTAVEEKEPR